MTHIKIDKENSESPKVPNMQQLIFRKFVQYFLTHVNDSPPSLHNGLHQIQESVEKSFADCVKEFGDAHLQNLQSIYQKIAPRLLGNMEDVTQKHVSKARRQSRTQVKDILKSEDRDASLLEYKHELLNQYYELSELMTTVWEAITNNPELDLDELFTKLSANVQYLDEDQYQAVLYRATIYANKVLYACYYSRFYQNHPEEFLHTAFGIDPEYSQGKVDIKYINGAVVIEVSSQELLRSIHGGSFKEEHMLRGFHPTTNINIYGLNQNIIFLFSSPDYDSSPFLLHEMTHRDNSFLFPAEEYRELFTTRLKDEILAHLFDGINSDPEKLKHKLGPNGHYNYIVERRLALESAADESNPNFYRQSQANMELNLFNEEWTVTRTSQYFSDMEHYVDIAYAFGRDYVYLLSMVPMNKWDRLYKLHDEIYGEST